MNRRRAVASLAICGLWAGGRSFAQTPGRVYRIGYLNQRSGPSGLEEAFARGLREQGYVVGRNVVIEYRWAAGDASRLPALAEELVRLKVDVIVTAATPATRAVMHATSTVPIVMAAIADPVSVGIVASLARPGGNVTGMTLQSLDLAAKRLQLLRELVPAARRIGILTLRIPDGLVDANAVPARALIAEMQAAAPQVGVAVVARDVADPRELPDAFTDLQRAQAQALFVQANPLSLQHQATIVELAAERRVPALYELRSFVDAGGLAAYGPDLADMYRRAAGFVVRILRGAKPGDLPIEQPEKLELVLNLKAAEALKLALPPALLARADEVIR